MISSLQNPETEHNLPIVRAELSISETFSKSVTVPTVNYISTGIEKDEDGNADLNIDWKNSDLSEIYSERYLTLKEILEQVPKVFSEILDYQLPPNLKKRLKVLRDNCLNWDENECEIISEK
jgi:hypothetical protein